MLVSTPGDARRLGDQALLDRGLDRFRAVFWVAPFARKHLLDRGGRGWLFGRADHRQHGGDRSADGDVAPVAAGERQVPGGRVVGQLGLGDVDVAAVGAEVARAAFLLGVLPDQLPLGVRPVPEPWVSRERSPAWPMWWTIAACRAPEAAIKAPPAPDPYRVAGAQTGQNVQSAIANSYLGNVDQVGPYGSTTYKQGGTSR